MSESFAQIAPPRGRGGLDHRVSRPPHAIGIFTNQQIGHCRKETEISFPRSSRDAVRDARVVSLVGWGRRAPRGHSPRGAGTRVSSTRPPGQTDVARFLALDSEIKIFLNHPTFGLRYTPPDGASAPANHSAVVLSLETTASTLAIFHQSASPLSPRRITGDSDASALDVPQASGSCVGSGWPWPALGSATHAAEPATVPHLVVMIGEEGYRTGETLPEFIQRELASSWLPDHDPPARPEQPQPFSRAGRAETGGPARAERATSPSPRSGADPHSRAISRRASHWSPLRTSSHAFALSSGQPPANQRAMARLRYRGTRRPLCGRPPEQGGDRRLDRPRRRETGNPRRLPSTSVPLGRITLQVGGPRVRRRPRCSAVRPSTRARTSATRSPGQIRSRTHASSTRRWATPTISSSPPSIACCRTPSSGP